MVVQLSPEMLREVRLRLRQSRVTEERCLDLLAEAHRVNSATGRQFWSAVVVMLSTLALLAVMVLAGGGA